MKELQEKGLDVSGVIFDITETESTRKAAESVEERFGKLDVLVNNAALIQGLSSIEEQSIDEVRLILDTNFVGTWNVTQKFIPLLKKSQHGRIVNVSSGAGSYNDPVFGLKARTSMQPSIYGISKLALNGLTVKMAKEFERNKILVNSVCPDVTDTHPEAGWSARPVPESAKGVVWAATLPDGGSTGGFFRDGTELPW